MNCDRVFDILTRGPFPTGDRSDAEVEFHLSACHTCRQLAEALRPALELFHESIDPHESVDLPGYRGALRESESNGLVSTINAVMSQVSVRSTVARKLAPLVRPSSISIWRIAAAVVLGVALGALLRAMGVSEHAAPVAADGQSSDGREIYAAAGQLPGADGLRLLAALNLPEVCFHRAQDGGGESTAAPADGSENVESQTADNAQCCTHCHTARPQGRAPVVTIARLTSDTCEVCHQ